MSNRSLVALVASAAVGYHIIDGLLRVVEQLAFCGVWVGLGALAVLSELIVAA
ncbi:hypothetical protein [Haladaptatus cibarius]|uniref:hypothetical protein n=1 Tax=Haladaptatus cibarius TaxID=453847 RepID=UPI000B2BA08F|nr:hypothetical protein [Haladaptatus cibarius]